MTRYVARPETASASVDGGMVVLHMGTKRYYSLNETGAELWRLLENGTTAALAADRLAQLYDVAQAEASRAVNRLIRDLIIEDLVAETHA
jgi:coenzyme PQQ synthesis protein D (PqqD)